MDKNAISDMLDGVKSYPFHMPGHKRNSALTDGEFPYHRDITEITGSDNLHSMSGVILEECNRAASLWGAAKAHLLVNGSTCGILAAIRAYGGHDRSVVVARNSHKSVYHGIELCRLNPTYLQPTVDPDSGICGSITPEQVEGALQSAPDAGLVIITSPTYEGVISDVAGIARVAHAHGAVLLVDAAHGAHLGLGGFAAHPITLGADVAICSLHKTLPAPTQTALALIGACCPCPEALAAQLAVFQTSSPSYILMEQSARCIHLLQSAGERLMYDWLCRLSAFEKAVQGLLHLQVLFRGELPDCAWAYDPGKLVISTRRTNLTGHALADILRNDYAIELEMAASDYVIAMTSLADTDQGLDRLAHALCKIDQGLVHTDDVPTLPIPGAQVALAPWCVADHQAESLPLAKAAGRVAAEYVWAYPPGIPLVVPGERLTDRLITALEQMQENGVALDSTNGGMPQTVRILKLMEDRYETDPK